MGTDSPSAGEVLRLIDDLVKYYPSQGEALSQLLQGLQQIQEQLASRVDTPSVPGDSSQVKPLSSTDAMATTNAQQLISLAEAFSTYLTAKKTNRQHITKAIVAHQPVLHTLAMRDDVIRCISSDVQSASLGIAGVRMLVLLKWVLSSSKGVTRQIREFIILVCQKAFWDTADLFSAKNPEEVLHDVVEALQDRLRERGPASKAAVIQLLIITLLISNAKPLEFATTLDLIERAYAKPGAISSSDRADVQRVKIAENGKSLMLLAKTPSKTALLNTCDITKPIRTALKTARREYRNLDETKQQLESRIDSQAERIDALNNLLTKYKQEIEDHRLTIEQRDAELEAAQARILELGELMALDKKQARMKAAGFLEQRILPLLVKAAETLSMQPPRVDVARERILFAQDDISKELACLKSLD